MKTTGAKQSAAKDFGPPIILTQTRVRIKHFLLKYLWNGWSDVFNSHLGFWSPWAVDAITLKWKMALAPSWSPLHFKQARIIADALEASYLLQERDSFGQFCTMSEVACGSYSGHETEERQTMLLWWGHMRKWDGCFWQSHGYTRHLWMLSDPKPPEQVSSRPLSRTWLPQSYLGSLECSRGAVPRRPVQKLSGNLRSVPTHLLHSQLPVMRGAAHCPRRAQRPQLGTLGKPLATQTHCLSQAVCCTDHCLAGHPFILKHVRCSAQQSTEL